MAERIANTVFLKILPVLLTAGIIWIMSSINGMQVQMVRIGELVNKNQEMLKESVQTIKHQQMVVVDQTITSRLLQAEFEQLQSDLAMIDVELTALERRVED